MNDKEKIVADLLEERKKRETEETDEFPPPETQIKIVDLEEVELLKLENISLKRSLVQNELNAIAATERDLCVSILERFEKSVENWDVVIQQNDLPKAVLRLKPKAPEEKPKAPEEKPEESDGS